MDTPKRWPDLEKFGEFGDFNSVLKKQCIQLIYELYDKSRRLNDEGQNYLSENHEVVTFDVNSIEDDSDTCSAVRVRECSYALSYTVDAYEAAEFNSSTFAPGSARAYVVEIADVNYAGLGDESDWHSFALVVDDCDEKGQKVVSLLDPATGKDLEPLFQQKLLAVLEMLNRELRSEMAFDRKLKNPDAERPRIGTKAFSPDEFICDASCELCFTHKVLCTHNNNN